MKDGDKLLEQWNAEMWLQALREAIIEADKRRRFFEISWIDEVSWK